MLSALLSAAVCAASLLVLVVATDRPIIGVLTQELPEEIRKQYSEKSSYMPASYVKALEAAGARVVPIFIRESDEYYRQIMTRINGLLFPGGVVHLEAPGGFAAAGKVILAFAEELQDYGIWFPILGVCQGYELMMYVAANTSSERDILSDCDALNAALPLDFRPGYQESQLYQHASDEILDVLATLPVTSNHHKHCVTEFKLKARNLEKTWRILSTNKDRRGLEFISSSEHFQRPFVGVQFHPEKNLFEWNRKQANPHSRKAILSARHFYDWLVAQSRRNNQSFPNSEDEKNILIYNYSPEFTGRANGYNEQVYFF